MENIITIDEKHRLYIEENNYALRRKRTAKKDGAVSWVTEGYYPDLVSLATSYLNDAPSRSETAIKSFQKLNDTIKTAESNIIKAISKI
jgi:hypothetical protein